MVTENNVLVVEDDADDRDLIYEAIKNENPHINVVFVENGVDALIYLDTLNKNNTPAPCLIILDLNLPLMDGKETMMKLKTNSYLNAIPVIIFTSSMNPNDKELFQNLGVEFITKPDHFLLMQDSVIYMLDKCKKPDKFS